MNGFSGESGSFANAQSIVNRAKTPTVWVVKEQVVNGNGMDYSGATPYGEIEFITKTDLPLHPNSNIKTQWSADVSRFAMDYQEDRDFIICTGQPSAIFAVGWALGMSNKKPRFLMWRREENRYRVLDVVQ